MNDETKRAQERPREVWEAAAEYVHRRLAELGLARDEKAPRKETES